MRKLLIGLGIPALVLGAGIVVSRMLASQPTDFVSADQPANPLASCPDVPNCIRTTRTYDLDADTLFDRAEATLRDMSPDELDVDGPARRIDAVFRVFFFYDDVALVVEPFENGAALHIRSASRVGQSDLGVNRRRVERFFDRLEA